MVQDASLTHMLHHSQLAFSEQAFGAVKRENIFFVKQAGKPVADNGATSQFNGFNGWMLRFEGKREDYPTFPLPHSPPSPLPHSR
ncbi:hypothetical protein Osc7112_2335 [Oscillatoria nigro-viridis PCC 7112]|uniref:Uncharacterized protein n=1 Tax=Phormidium nigroviride PCC 7112 TaxID=179408 RepID=K9VHR2_9CYAN|nr:hypothetical protein Osc7112_2335 [Oscillatoria nigro-viridis PCC 7112]